jgi:hypothetical protein
MEKGNPFGQTEVVPKTGSVAVQADRAVSEVKAQVIMAMQYPRNPVDCMDRILKECGRATLAEEAIYTYPRGGTQVTGPSIRLAECVMRGWRNMVAGVIEVERNEKESSLVSYAWDMETNTSHRIEFKVSHTRDTKRGQKDLTDERDIYEKVANYGARRKRACILALIPGDVVDAAVDACYKTLKAKIGDVEKAKEAMFKAFEKYGVTKEMIEKRLGHHAESIEAGEIVNLRGIFNSIKEGMAPVSQFFDFEKKAEDIVGEAKPEGEKTGDGQTQTQPEGKPEGEPEKTPQKHQASEETREDQAAQAQAARDNAKKYSDIVSALIDLMNTGELPEVCVKEIVKTINSGEQDIGKLAALLERTKTALQARGKKV